MQRQKSALCRRSRANAGTLCRLLTLTFLLILLKETEGFILWFLFICLFFGKSKLGQFKHT